MDLLRQLAVYCAVLLTGGFTAVTGWKLYTGGISLEGLLDSFDGGPRQSSPARLQLLLFTVGVAVQYVSAVWKNPDATSLPPVPQGVLAVLAGSQGVYLGGKALSTYLPILKGSK